MSHTDVPVAIVGIGCRFPGGVDSPEDLWRLLIRGGDAVTEIPSDRFDLQGLFDPDPAAPGKIYTRWGGFLDRIDGFDADFFGIAPREARRMDPQQRLLLEVVWEALDDGGQAPDRLAGSDTGVFVGISTHDYVDVQDLSHHRDRIDAHVNAGTAACIAANRVSYLLDLRGPSFTVDTACSSSLTAVHLACRSLAAGDCGLAIVGGVGVLLAPEVTIGFCKASMLSPSGRCRTFDAGADGYARSEGTGAVILKRLDRAIADRDPIHAVIRGSAINQDGRTPGLSVPSAAAQRRMIEQALSRAGVRPAEVHYVEAHGTGTAVGDPIEAQAIGEALSPGRARDEPCLVGSVKTNLGHLEAAAGMAGLIKAALAVEHRQVPPNLHFSEPNPAIPLDELGLRVPTKVEPWPHATASALAGVNSFGFGGANAHVVLEGPPRPATRPRSDDEPVARNEKDAQVLTISARDPEALRELARRHRLRLGEDAGVSLHDHCYTAAVRRSHHSERLAIVSRSREEAVEHLDSFLSGADGAEFAVGRARTGQAPRLAFVFSGMGPQWWGMGRQLLAAEQVFRHALEEVDETLRPLAGWSLLEELGRNEAASRVADADIAHVANFAVQVGLAALWRSWGVVPDAVIGHSSGEMAAACVSGALTVADAVSLAYHRGRLQHRTTGTGRMVAAAISPDEAEHILAGREHAVSLAAVNSRSSITLSGTADALEEIAHQLIARQRFARFLPVEVPYHGPQMDAIRGELVAALRDLSPRPTGIPMVSTVSGDWIDGRALDADYWWGNVRRPVLFAAATDRLVQDGCEVLVELGPHPVLAVPLSECLTEHDSRAIVLPSLRRDEDERTVMLRTLADLHVRGRKVRWQGVVPVGTCVALPPYPWQRERHWFDADQEPTSGPARSTGVDTGHPLLGRRLASAQPIWEVSLEDRAVDFLDAHVVQGAALFPGAAYLEMAMAAGRELWGEEPVRIEDVRFLKMMFLASPRRGLVQLHVHPRDSVVEIHGATGDDGASWELHTSARLTRDAGVVIEPFDLQALRARCSEPVSRDEHYSFFKRSGFDFGDAFLTLQEIWFGTDAALARVAFPANVDLPVEDYRTHPALLDAALQLVGSLSLHSAVDRHHDATFLPVSVRRLAFRHAPGTRFWAYVELRPGDDRRIDDVEGDAWLIDEDGEVAVAMEGLRIRVLEQGATPETISIDDGVYELRWEEAPLEAVPAESAVPPGASREVAADLERCSGTPEHVPQVARYLDMVEPCMDRVAEGFTLAALEAMGWNPERGATEPIARLADALEVAPHHRRLFSALIGTLSKSGLHETASPGSVPRDHAALNRLLDDLIAAEPQYAAEAELLRRGGTHLADVLRGDMDAREVLLNADALVLLERFYTTSPPCRSYHELLADAVAATAERARASSPLRVLEIGAGTGAATASVLPRLPADTSYTFTDVSPYFLEEARERFSDRPATYFATLDIEADPTAQGFRPRSFDLVLAANVLHVTTDLETTLRNVRHLLAGGGVLALLELTRRSSWLNLVFGLLEGWWRFTDVHLRSGGPMLDPGGWHDLLEESGFEGVTTLHANAVGERTVQTVQLAHAPATARAEAPRGEEASPRHWLLFADDAGTADGLTEALSGRGGRCTHVRPGPAFRRNRDGSFDLPPLDGSAYARLLEEVRAEAPLHGVLHLWSLRAVAGDGTDAATLMSEQRFGCGSVRTLMKALDSSRGAAPELWMVTAGAQPVEGHDAAPNVVQSALWGLGRVLMSERDAARCVLVDLAPVPAAEDIEALAAELSVEGGEGVEDELALRGRLRFARRLRRASLADHTRPTLSRRLTTATDAFRLEVGAPGAIDSLLLREAVDTGPGPGEVQIRVRASGLNFRDVLQTLDMLPPAAYQHEPDPEALGIECAGIVLSCGTGVERFRPGDEVIALAAAAHGSRVVAAEHLTVLKPASVSFEEAASILNGFVTAEYALNHVARIEEGERVLIHSATGAVGLAAIQLCHRAGAEVFATAGTPEKRRYLSSLGVEHVMDSRSLAFADEILRDTGGEGVDVILNSLSGDAILKGLSILRPYGRFVELGKRDIFADAQVGLAPFQRNLSFHAVDLIPMALDRPTRARNLLEHVVRQVSDGVVEVVPVTAFDLAEAEQAFRLMAQARHIGKIVLTMELESYAVQARTEAPLVHADGSYLVTGGLGGFGLTIAEWLTREGAGSVVLMSRTGTPREEEIPLLEALHALSDRVTVICGDVSDEQDVQRVLDHVRRELPPLKGVFHAAMVLDDDVLVHLNQERFDRVLAPKVAGGWNLHRLTRNDDLDLFVLFSSVAAVVGQPMQGNYAAANTFLDALASHRQASGLPAVSIAWGALADVGYISHHHELAQYLDRGGFGSFTPARALETLDRLLRHDFDHVVAAEMDWLKWSELNPLAADSRRFRDLMVDPDAVATAQARAAVGSVLTRLRDAAPGDRLALLSDHLVQKVARVLGTIPQKVDPERPFTESGFDSLMAVELVTAIKADFGVKVPVVAILQGTNARELAERLLDQLALDLEGADTRESGSPLITRAQPNERHPLSSEQRRFWFLEHLHPGAAAHHVSVAIRLSGTLDREALEHSTTEVLTRHEVLRAAIEEIDGTPVQRFVSPEPASLPVVDLTGLDEAERETELQRRATEEMQRPFDLGRGSLMRVTLFHLGPREHVVLLVVHHIATDAWSMNMLVREMAALYEAFSGGRPSPLAPPPIRYLDHIEQQSRLDREAIDGHLEYWKRQLLGAPASLRLPGARRPPVSRPGVRGGHLHFELSVQTTDALRDLGKREGATLFMILLAAFQTLLHRNSGEDDICVGTAVSTRTEPGAEAVAGCYMNTLVLRSDLSGDPTFRQLLERVKRTTLDAFEHQDVPFDDVVGALCPERGPDGHPFFRALLVLHNARMPALRLAGLDFEKVEVESGSAVTDLALLLDDGEWLSGMLEYDADQFDEQSVELMISQLRTLLDSIAAEPERPLSVLPLQAEAHRHQAVAEWNDTTTNYGTPACTHQLVEAQVARTPEAAAVVHENTSLSYQELDRQANHLAHRLQELGVGPDGIVGVCMGRSPQTVVAALGILKAGGAYLPLDSTHPTERLRSVLRDAGASVLVTRAGLRHGLSADDLQIVALGADDVGTAGRRDAPTSAVGPENLAYVIYTSGSTGLPQGVMIPHRAIFNQLRWRQQAFPLSNADVVLQRTPLGFDPSIWELFGPLTAGARVVVPRAGMEGDAAYVVGLIREQNVTHLQVTPSVLDAMLEHPEIEDCDCIQQVFCGGETLPPGLPPRFFARLSAELHNLYGPAETTIDAVQWTCRPDDDRPFVPIGRPIANARVYVLDDRLQPVPAGVSGELHIGGAGLARGYLNRPELTDARFIRDPFGAAPDERLYRTGDIARRLPDGSIEFLGRKDHQVKVRGMRVEPTEVETVLTAYPGIREAVVASREDRTGATSLVAFVVADASVSSLDVRRCAADRLPSYMVPTTVTLLERLPRVANEKVDRALLARWAQLPPGRTGERVAPRDEVELRLLHIWEEFFPEQDVGVTDDFFQLGGHSLLAMRVMARLQEVFDRQLPVSSLIRGRTIEQQACLLRERPGSRSSLIALQPRGEKPPFFCVHPVGGTAFCYLELAAAMGTDRPFYGLESADPRSSEATDRIEDMAHHYLQEMRSVQTRGPYLLGGWSMGGVIAFEMARRLEAQGDSVAHLVVMDAWVPSSPPDEVQEEEAALLRSFMDNLGLRAEGHAPSAGEDVRIVPDARLADVLEQARDLDLVPPDLEPAEFEQQLSVFVAHLTAMRSYAPGTYTGTVTLLEAGEPIEGVTRHGPRWEELVNGSVMRHTIPGNHYTMLKQPHVAALGQWLSRRFEDVVSVGL